MVVSALVTHAEYQPERYVLSMGLQGCLESRTSPLHSGELNTTPAETRSIYYAAMILNDRQFSWRPGDLHDAYVKDVVSPEEAICSLHRPPVGNLDFRGIIALSQSRDPKHLHTGKQVVSEAHSWCPLAAIRLAP
jgi:hypothetical protein